MDCIVAISSSDSFFCWVVFFFLTSFLDEFIVGERSGVTQHQKLGCGFVFVGEKSLVWVHEICAAPPQLSFHIYSQPGYFNFFNPLHYMVTYGSALSFWHFADHITVVSCHMSLPARNWPDTTFSRAFPPDHQPVVE